MSDDLYVGGVVAFAVDTTGTVVPHVVSAAASAAYDILTDGGVPAEKAAEMSVMADKAWRDGAVGRTPEQMARHILKLRGAVRGREDR